MDAPTTYGIGETGDWLQLGAASSWMLANLFALVNIDPSTCLLYTSPSPRDP